MPKIMRWGRDVDRQCSMRTIPARFGWQKPEPKPGSRTRSLAIAGRIYFVRTTCTRRCGPKKGTVRKRKTHEVELLQFLPSGRCVVVKDTRTPGSRQSGRGDIFTKKNAATYHAGTVIPGIISGNFEEKL